MAFPTNMMRRCLILPLVIFAVRAAVRASPAADEMDVSAMLDEIDDLLAGCSRLEAQVDQVLQEMDHGTAEIKQQIQQERLVYEQHQGVIQSTWTAWNKHTWQALQTKLQSALNQEKIRRNDAQQQWEDYKRRLQHVQRQQEQAAAGQPIEKMPPPVGLTMAQVEEILSPTALIQERDQLLGAWIVDLMKQTVAERRQPTWEWAEHVDLDNITATLAKSMDQESATARDDKDEPVQGCWTLLDSVVHMQQVLSNYSHDDGLGVTDHARGGRIVHHETSPTYQTTSSLSSETTTTWGSSILRDYLIPQDVEEYILSLVDGWQEWPVWPSVDLSHNLARWTNAAETTAPPETILQGATWPGACWPMQGSKGHVTMVLPYPIHPTAISIDHVSRLLVKDRQAAPKTMRLSAFEPCEDECHGLEYDPEQAYDLFRGQTIEYDLDGNSVQTFWLPPPKLVKADENADPLSCAAPEDDEDEEAAVASCSGEPLSTLSPDALVRAIKIEVLDNWGNGDFTCLYRIRVHGTPAAKTTH